MTNSEFVTDFMENKEVLHNLFGINGLYIYSLILLNEIDIPEEYKTMTFVPEYRWRQCAADFIKHYEDHCAQNR